MKSKYVIIFGIILLPIIGFINFLSLNDKNVSAVKKSSPNNAVTKESITISPQIVKDRVIVAQATLTKNGFVVVREIEGNKLSQVVEMSKPLKKGTHKNITIPLGNADVSSAELTVMIYDDYDNDGIFNDFDMPAINREGFMTANYVKTGASLSESITEGNSSGGAMTHNMPGMKSMVRVHYNDKGFVPEKIEVSTGSMVEFVNDSSTVMWVASSEHPSHTDLPTFDQFKPYKKGSIYRYVFDKKGTWKYHDHINANVGGVVKVT